MIYLTKCKLQLIYNIINQFQFKKIHLSPKTLKRIENRTQLVAITKQNSLILLLFSVSNLNPAKKKYPT